MRLDVNGKLRLQIAVPIQGVFVLGDATYGQLGVGYLGGQAVNSALFVLGASKLDVDKLGQVGDDTNRQWEDVIADAQSIQVQRGANVGNGIWPELDVGTLRVTLVGKQYDPSVRQATFPGTPIRLVTSAGTVAFTGVVNRAITTHGIDPAPTVVNITAVDRVNQLKNIPQTGGVAQTFDQRVTALCQPNGIPFSSFDGSSALAANLLQGNLLDHLELAVRSENGFFYVGNDNAVYAYGHDWTIPDSGVSLRSDDSAPGFTAIQSGIDTGALFNVITLQNLTTGVDSSNNATSVQTDNTYSDSTSIATYMSQSTAFTTNLANQTDIDALGNALLTKLKTPADTVTSVTFNPMEDYDLAAGVEVFSTVHIYFNNGYAVIDRDFQIASIQHDITPDRWLVTLAVISL